MTFNLVNITINYFLFLKLICFSISLKMKSQIKSLIKKMTYDVILN